MGNWIPLFIDLGNPNVQWVVIGTILIGLSSAIVGCFTVLNRKSLVGDAISHAVLPGVAMAFMFFNSKSPFVLLFGALVTGWLSIITIDAIEKYSRIKSDAAIGLVMSVFFGVGILLMTRIQHSGNAAQSGLDHFLFGKAASLVGTDLWVALGVCAIVILVVILHFRQFQIMTFDPEFAESSGLPVNWLRFLMSFITVLVVTVGIQIVGVVLMSALLITPAVAARYWTDDLKSMLGIASFVSVISCLGGVFLSFAVAKMPTGPWIVVFVSLCTFFSILFAPKNGWFKSWLDKRQHVRKIAEENVIKAFFHLGEERGDYKTPRTFAVLQEKKNFDPVKLKGEIRRLLKEGLLIEKDQAFSLTEDGKKEAFRIVRLHRLWEMYLTRKLQIDAKHVHQNAEAVEHIITPEIEKELLADLDFPEYDPHDKPIPYPI